ncbi:acyl-CoA thioesterase II [Lapillicoccus sp.]|uniref:acyl-CoA thioesterase n=1 Tax=Lapillicoccus sp. TaxID=1909287 RepID=UPI0025F7D642|nr:acyl-CoA thioesterase II [Lapillicoccus sp.]
MTDDLTDPASPDTRPDPAAAPSLPALIELLEVLDLQPLGSAHISVKGAAGDAETDLGLSSAAVFVGQSQKQHHGRVFGGQVLAQSVIAAGRTVEGVGDTPRHIHSLHGYFVRAGDDSHPIRFAVENIRDGNSFSTRRVHAIQYGKPILSMITSFQSQSDGLEHQDAMPAAPDPESLPSLAEVARTVDDPRTRHFARDRPIDLRHVEGQIHVRPGRQLAPQQSVWLKAIGPLPDDPLLHAAVLAYASDYSLLEPILRRHGLAWSDPRLRVASLDHAMWFHRPGRADEWVLYTERSPTAQGGRGLSTGQMFSSDGALIATVAQEGMTRLKG